MKLFSSKLKKKTGTKSTIAEMRSPYVGFSKPKKFFFKKGRRIKKNSLIIKPARLGGTGKLRKILTVLVVLALFGSGLYSLFFSHFFDLKTVEIFEDGVTAPADSPLFTYLEPLKTKNIFFIQESKLDYELKLLYPEIKRLKIKKILPQKLKIEIEKYPVLANVINIIGTVQKKYLINSLGFLTQENVENPDLPYIKITTDEALPVRTIVIPRERLDYVIKAVYLFEEKFGMKVLHAYYFSREREVHLLTEKYFMVWIDIGKDLKIQLEKLKKIIPKLDIYKVPLQYIDLRISGTDNEKVIYKKK